MVIRTNQVPSQQQLVIIAEQLGRTPHGTEAIAATDENGMPLVLRMAPIIDDKPFPTLYWLCDKRLKIELSRLEAGGIIKQLEMRLQSDQDFLAGYHRSHEDYIARRWHYMSTAQQETVERLGYRPLLEARGIGGLGNWNQVRCLHTQYAHHLCGDNVIGEWLDNELAVIDSLS